MSLPQTRRPYHLKDTAQIPPQVLPCCARMWAQLPGAGRGESAEWVLERGAAGIRHTAGAQLLSCTLSTFLHHRTCPLSPLPNGTPTVLLRGRQRCAPFVRVKRHLEWGDHVPENGRDGSPKGSAPSQSAPRWPASLLHRRAEHRLVTKARCPLSSRHPVPQPKSELESTHRVETRNVAGQGHGVTELKGDQRPPASWPH